MIPRARNTDLASSHVAAAMAAAFAGSHAQRILTALQEHGPATAHELEHITGLTVVQIDRRVSEMRAEGKLRISKDERGDALMRNSPLGRPATVWEACVGGMTW